jgi:hypothetical protein
MMEAEEAPLREVPFWFNNAFRLSVTETVGAQISRLLGWLGPDGLAMAMGLQPATVARWESVGQVTDRYEPHLTVIFRLVKGSIDYAGSEELGIQLFCQSLPSLDGKSLMEVCGQIDDEAELLALQRATLEWVCPGCTSEIVDGQHYIWAPLELRTRDSGGHLPPVPPTRIYANVHHPGCLAEWAGHHGIMQSVFAH